MTSDTISRPPNGFLSALSADDFELIRPHLRTADLVQETVLVEVGERLTRVYLPHRGVISLVVKLAKGEHVQIAMIGRDSILGAFSTLGDATAISSAVVLVSGTASTVELDRLRDATQRSANLRALLARHGLAAYAQIQQTAGCNAAHTVEARLARCLLQVHDLSGGRELALTQENYIHYRRGHIVITNLEGLSKTSCECYATVKANYERLLRTRLSS
jgi:CRP-like cAMP-binding protein